MEMIFKKHDVLIENLNRTGLCVCSACPLNVYAMDHNFKRYDNFCMPQQGRIEFPDKNHCKTGDMAIWMMTHNPEQVVEFISELQKKAS